MQKLAFWMILLHPVFIFMRYQSMYLKLEHLSTSFDIGVTVGGVDCLYRISLLYMCVCISYVFHDCYEPAFVIAYSCNIHCTCELGVRQKLILTCWYYIPVRKRWTFSVICLCMCATGESTWTYSWKLYYWVQYGYRCFLVLNLHKILTPY